MYYGNGLAIKVEAIPESDSEDGTTENCTVCHEYGACRDWIEGMEADSAVPAEWIAERVLDGTIDHNWTVTMVQEAYSQWQFEVITSEP